VAIRSGCSVLAMLGFDALCHPVSLVCSRLVTSHDMVSGTGWTVKAHDRRYSSKSSQQTTDIHVLQGNEYYTIEFLLIFNFYSSSRHVLGFRSAVKKVKAG